MYCVGRSFWLWAPGILCFEKTNNVIIMIMNELIMMNNLIMYRSLAPTSVQSDICISNDSSCAVVNYTVSD